MTKKLLVLLALSAVFLSSALAAGGLSELNMPEGVNLLADSAMLPDSPGRAWRVSSSAIKWGFADIDGRRMARFSSSTSGYHHGPSTTLPDLLPGRKYLLAMIIKADIKDNQGKCVIFNINGREKYNGGTLHVSKWRERTDIPFDWTLHHHFFVTPKEFSEKNLTLYAFLLHGSCEGAIPKSRCPFTNF